MIQPGNFNFLKKWFPWLSFDFWVGSDAFIGEKSSKHFLGIDKVVSNCLWEIFRMLESAYRLASRKHTVLRGEVSHISQKLLDWSKKWTKMNMSQNVIQNASHFITSPTQSTNTNETEGKSILTMNAKWCHGKAQAAIPLCHRYSLVNPWADEFRKIREFSHKQ